MKKESKEQKDSAAYILKLVSAYFGSTENDSYIEEINGKEVIFVSYYDFKPVEEVDSFIRCCIDLVDKQVQCGEVSRKFSQQALRLQYQLDKQLSKFSFI